MADQAEQKYDDTKNNTPEEESPEKKSRRKLIIIAVVVLLAIGAALFYWHSTFTEDTDDAQVDGDLYQVSARVAGQVIKVYVQDNQAVKAGDPIAEIDPKDFQVALEQAQANLSSAEAAAIQANVNVPITSITSNTSINTTSSDVLGSQAAVSQSQKQVAAAQARIDQAKANAIKSDLDVERYKPLVEKDVISKQQFDAAVATAASNRAAVLEAEATLIGQQEAVRQSQQKLLQSRSTAIEASKNGPSQVKAQQARAEAALADVKQAQARVDQAKLNLSYTHVVAPTTGVINKKNVQVGMNLSVGQDLLTIVPLTDLWVTANFKETQLDRMHPGQKVTIEVDALGGRKFHGEIKQIGGATGSRLSLFPPENATGNYVKVVQRIPVRINFTNLDDENKDLALRPGFSVTPIVAVK
ncbi:MAG: HlyD family secretion protein [Edaphobacter sp.]|uniref:HlyD family secretion protein n=1 Tax=Edaphobacter sp. TaxID=1934404 RepID=UPI0023A356A3|nr:HlyD family secretion protein [Edaphobacter sp.]MDE1175542.1 HlyD family secretion protein [Edaphobacter sp.]